MLKNEKIDELSVTFLVPDIVAAKQSGTTFSRLAHACRIKGWQAEAVCIDSLTLINNRAHWRSENDGQWQGAEDTDMLWVLGLGQRQTFLDKVQILWLAEQYIPVINSPTALAFWHGKYLPAGLDIPNLQVPVTMASSVAEWLWSKICLQGGDWVAKPPGGSHGLAVQKIQAQGSQGLATLKQLTKFGYCLVQKYIPAITQGEKRVLIAGEKVIGQYLRLPMQDFRTNLAQGGKAATCGLSDQESTAMQVLAKTLNQQGIQFAGVDLCWPWLIEINIACPGGLDTIARLSEDASSQALEAVINQFTPQQRRPKA